MAKKSEYNQTSFSQDQPLYEKELEVPVEEPSSSELNPSNKSWYKRRLIWAIAGAGLLFVVFLLALLATDNGQSPIAPTSPEEMAEMEQESGPFVNRINQLETELEAADPTKPQLIFPPVDMSLSLDEPE